MAEPQVTKKKKPLPPNLEQSWAWKWLSNWPMPSASPAVTWSLQSEADARKSHCLWSNRKRLTGLRGCRLVSDPLLAYMVRRQKTREETHSCTHPHSQKPLCAGGPCHQPCPSCKMLLLTAGGSWGQLKGRGTAGTCSQGPGLA